MSIVTHPGMSVQLCDETEYPIPGLFGRGEARARILAGKSALSETGVLSKLLRSEGFTLPMVSRRKDLDRLT